MLLNFFFSEKICTFAKIFLLSLLLKDYFFKLENGIPTHGTHISTAKQHYQYASKEKS